MAACNRCGREAGYLYSICKICQAKRQGSASRPSPSFTISTHYDTLKVAWFAPEQVVRAAYRALCQMHHPDKNIVTTASLETMKAINAAYDALQDPIKRAEHDRWIRMQTGR